MDKLYLCGFIRISYGVCIVQHWLSHIGEAENSGVAQSSGLDISAVPSLVLKSLEDSWKAAGLQYALGAQRSYP